MAKKKTTTKGTASNAAPKSDVNKTDAIKDVLARTPDKPPKQISEELTAKGIDVSPGYVSTIKTNLKKAEAEAGTSQEPQAETAAPKLKAVKAKRTTKQAAPKKKVRRKKRVAKQVAPQVAPQAARASSISYDRLQQAKALAQQLGGLEKAREALAALSNLQE
jgi:hypothetical protein